jgi:hypothetical protein
MNIIGARWKSVLKGFDVAGVCWRRSCVNDHLNPESAEAVMTSMNLTVNNAKEEGGSSKGVVPNENELTFSGNHENDADSNRCDDGDEFKVGSFEVEEECENQDKRQRR